MDTKGYTMRCDCHTYVSLYKDGNFVFSLDNFTYTVEGMIFRVEQETGLRFEDIPLDCKPRMFNGLVFNGCADYNDFWEAIKNRGNVKQIVKNGGGEWHRGRKDIFC